MAPLRAFLKTAPQEAAADLLGIAAIGLMIFAGFTVPALV